MPQSYLQRALAKQGLLGTLKRRQTLVYKTTLKIVDTRESKWKDEPLKYFPTTVNYKKHKLPEGWTDVVDEAIWVSPHLKFEKGGNNSDAVVIDGEWYDIKYSTKSKYENHVYQILGLRKMVGDPL